MKVLVTGASGTLGGALLRRLKKTHQVLGISLSGKNDTLSVDLRQKDPVSSLFTKNSAELVIHAAAYSDVDGCERDPLLAHESNAVATKHLAAECSARKIPLIYVSTDYVFDGTKQAPYLENDATRPINIYGLTKLEGEYHAKNMHSLSAIVRTSWLFGDSASKNFVSVIRDRMKTEKVLRVLDDQENSPTYAEDLAEALEKIGAELVSSAKKTPKEAGCEIYQFCNAGVTTRYAMTLKMKDFLGLKDLRVEKISAKELPARLAIRPRHSAMSQAFYEKSFGVKIRSWEEALKTHLIGRPS